MGEPGAGDYPVAGHYRVIVWVDRRGYTTVMVVRRLWDGNDAMDRRLDRHHFRLVPTEPAASSVRSLLVRVLRHLTDGLTP